MKKTLMIMLVAAFAFGAMPIASNAAGSYDLKIVRKPHIVRTIPALKIMPKLTVTPTRTIKFPTRPVVIPPHVKYSGDYAVEYDLSNVEIAIAGSRQTVSLDEVRSGGVAVGSIAIPAEIADELEEMLADQFNLDIQKKHFGRLHKITMQSGDNPPLHGIANRKTKQFVVTRLGLQPSEDGQCLALGGTIAGGTFSLQDGNPVIDGSSTVGIVIGCQGLAISAKATIHWDAERIN